MNYEGPVYRPPSEADSLLIQATVGCPHNKCTFCMIYKNGPPFKVRPVEVIKKDLEKAGQLYGPHVRRIFLPAGNTIAMRTEQLCAVCEYTRSLFPDLERLTVYGSSRYIHRKGPEKLKQLAQAGLSRVHAGLESGDDETLRRIRKGSTGAQQTEAGQWVMNAGMELSLYVLLGIAGRKYSETHALETARVLNAINPDFIRFRTFVPKINTPVLDDVLTGRFEMLSPHEILAETAMIIEHLKVTSFVASDHYSNYVNVQGRLPGEKEKMRRMIAEAMKKDVSGFRPFFIGRQ